MPTKKKRTITIVLFSCAGVIAAVAVALAARNPSEPPPRIVVAPPPQVYPHPPVVNHSPTPPPPTPTPPTPPTTVEPDKPIAQKKHVRPQVDVVFALDTTGSMTGLIAGAKRKIWSMANKILSGQPRPHVRIGLIAYRDIGDAYVTRRYALTEDIDDVQRRLGRLTAAGGGDTPEHVNRAIADAIYKMQWRKGQNVLRMIFLVGDAPPHEGRQGLYSRQLAAAAKQRNIIINAVRCGNMASTELAWRRISTIAGGMYASIRQDGGMLAIRTPHDRRLADLNRKLTATLLPAGHTRGRRAAHARARANAALDAWGGAESATYRARSGRLDSKDLLTQLKRGRKLSSFKKADLPAPLAALAAPARAAYVRNVAQRREHLRQRILKVAKEREAYIRGRAKRRPRRALDDKLLDALKTQGAGAGLRY